MIIHSYENSPRADACIDYLRRCPLADSVEEIVLLPIPTTRDNVTVLNTKVSINDVLEALDQETVVSGYGLPRLFVNGAEARGAALVDLSLDEEFLSENAELTALAALGILLNSTTSSLRDMNVGIVGYGRIGRRLTNMLLYLGTRVRVYTTRPDLRLDLCEYGVATAASAADADLRGLDVLINTAPAAIFSPESVPHGLRIMELASGDNFVGIGGVERYPSIPAKMFPKSAGRAWGRTIERFLNQNI